SANVLEDPERDANPGHGEHAESSVQIPIRPPTEEIGRRLPVQTRIRSAPKKCHERSSVAAASRLRLNPAPTKADNNAMRFHCLLPVALLCALVFAGAASAGTPRFALFDVHTDLAQ